MNLVVSHYSIMGVLLLSLLQTTESAHVWGPSWFTVAIPLMRGLDSCLLGAMIERELVELPL